MSSTVVWDPADGLAIARCQLARFADSVHRLTASHPSSCQWCPWPDDEVDRLVRGFNDWSGLNTRTGVYAQFEVRRFREQPEREQREQITAAQALTGEPWPLIVATTDPVGGSDSSEVAVDVGPHGSRVSGQTGSNVPPDPAGPRPDWLGGPS